jgi:type IV pilus assembly protein PilA
MRRHRNGFSLIELVIVMTIIMILATIVIGQVGKQIMMAHETAAFQQIKTIDTAEAQYFGQFGKYAANLLALGPRAAGLIPETLAGGKRSGYVYEVHATDDGYQVTAVPEKFGSSGRRSFFSDQTLVIRESWTTEAANAESAAAIQ